MGEVLGEERVDFSVALCRVGVEGGGGCTRGGGHAVAAGGRVVVLALVLLVAHDGLARDLEAAAGPLPAALGRLQGGSDAVLDVAVGPARGRDVGPLLVLFMGALCLELRPLSTGMKMRGIMVSGGRPLSTFFRGNSAASL